MRLINKKGFALIDCLLSLLLITSLMLVSIKNFRQISFDSYYLMNEMLDKKSSAISQKERKEVDGYNIYFNQQGNANRAQTIDFDNKKVVIHLGSGYFTHE